MNARLNDLAQLYALRILASWGGKYDDWRHYGLGTDPDFPAGVRVST